MRRHREEYGIARRANAILLCQRFFGVTTLEDLTEACLNAWENVPQQFFQNIFFRSHFLNLAIQIYLFGMKMSFSMLK